MSIFVVGGCDWFDFFYVQLKFKSREALHDKIVAQRSTSITVNKL